MLSLQTGYYPGGRMPPKSILSPMPAPTNPAGNGAGNALAPAPPAAAPSAGGAGGGANPYQGILDAYHQRYGARSLGGGGMMQRTNTLADTYGQQNRNRALMQWAQQQKAYIDSKKAPPAPPKMNIAQPGGPTNWWANYGVQTVAKPGTPPPAAPGMAPPPTPAPMPYGTPTVIPSPGGYPGVRQPINAPMVPQGVPTTGSSPRSPVPVPLNAGQAASPPIRPIPQPASPGWTSSLSGAPVPQYGPPASPAMPPTGNPYVDQAISQTQAAQDQANAANQARYDESLRLNDQGGYNQLADQNATRAGLKNDVAQGTAAKMGYLGNAYGDLTDLLNSQRQSELGFADTQHGVETGLANQFGQAATARNDRTLKNELGTLNAQAQAAGLASTSVPQAGIRGAFDDSALRQQQIDEDVARQKLGIEQGYGGQRLGLMGNLDASQLGLGTNFASTGYGALSQGADQNLNLDSAYGSDRQNLLNLLRTDREGILQSKTDQAPDINLLAQLLSQARGGGTYPNFNLSGYGTGGGYGQALAAMQAMAGRQHATGQGFRAGGYSGGGDPFASSFDLTGGLNGPVPAAVYGGSIGTGGPPNGYLMYGSSDPNNPNNYVNYVNGIPYDRDGGYAT